MTPCIMQLASQRVIQLLVNPWVLQLLFRIIMTRYDKCLQEFAYAGCGFAVCARDCYDLLSDKQHMQNTHEYSVYLSLFTRIAHLALDKVFKWSPKMTKHDHIFFVRFHGSMVSVSCETPLRAVCHLHHRVNHASRPLCRGTEFGGACKEIGETRHSGGGMELSMILHEKCMKSTALDSISCIAWLSCFWKHNMSGTSRNMLA